jgi:ATP phosphoribosyltransferase regulatory subunit
MENKMQNDAWLLPDGIDEMLPDEARRLEILRAKLLKTFELWGYELVVPPFIDFLDSLLTGSGHELDLQTFKLTDQISGKMLGVRADMTPQVARIDAHNLKNNHPTRLCYVGTILHTRGDALEKSRSPMQIGAELYGHAGKESDLEVIRLMLEMLAMSGVLNVHLDLGHVGIYRALAEEANLTHAQESELFDVLQRKARPELKELLESYHLAADLKIALLKLPELNGDKTVLAKARELFKSAKAQKALDDLEAISTALERYFSSLSISFDLAELRGYHYHTGVVFAAFVPSIGKEIARGGRYDNIGAIFGRERPATGFSADLKVLTALNKQNGIEQPERELIFAPYIEDVALCETIRDCRAQNRAVVQQLPNQIGGATELNCTAVLVKNSLGEWIVESI